jgi:hypothetical protein
MRAVSHPPAFTNHIWKPGVSGNPLGNATHRVTLARQVRHLSQDGHELVAFLFAVLRGEAMHLPGENGRHAEGRPPRPSLDQRLRAAELLMDRGWGRAKELLELHQDDAATRQERVTLLSALSTDELAQMRTLLETARARIVQAGTPPLAAPAPLETAATPDAPASSTGPAIPPSA